MNNSASVTRALEAITEAAELLDACGEVTDEEFELLVGAYQQLLATLKNKAYPEQSPEGSFVWLEENYVPQSMQFMIDVLPVIHELLLKHFRRSDTVSFLDVGPGSGSGANLIGTLHRSHALWSAIKVDAIDIMSSRKRYASLMFPDVRLEIGDIKDLPDGRHWDIVYCSHTIEHVTDPAAFLAHLVRISKRFVIVYAPYDEKELITGHCNRITETTFESYKPILVRKVRSLGWHPARGDLCLLVVIDVTA